MKLTSVLPIVSEEGVIGARKEPVTPAVRCPYSMPHTPLFTEVDHSAMRGPTLAGYVTFSYSISLLAVCARHWHLLPKLSKNGGSCRKFGQEMLGESPPEHPSRDVC
jgi:hypothetical protein